MAPDMNTKTHDDAEFFFCDHPTCAREAINYIETGFHHDAPDEPLRLCKEHRDAFYIEYWGFIPPDPNE